MRAHLNVHSSEVLYFFASFYVRYELKWFLAANEKNTATVKCRGNSRTDSTCCCYCLALLFLTNSRMPIIKG